MSRAALTRGALVLVCACAYAVPARANFITFEPLGCTCAGLLPLLAAEYLAVTIEARAYARYLRYEPRQALRLSLACNLLSIVVGSVAAFFALGLVPLNAWPAAAAAFVTTVLSEAAFVTAVAWSRRESVWEAFGVVACVHVVSWPVAVGTFIVLAYMGAGLAAVFA